MKIRIKVKHLVITIAALLLVVAAAYYGLLPGQEEAVSNMKPEPATAMGKEETLRLIQGAKGEKKWEYIREYMIESNGGSLSDAFDVYVGPGNSQWSSSLENGQKPRFSLEESQPYLEEYIESGPADAFLMGAAEQLSYYYNRSGQWVKALDSLALAGKRLPPSQSYGKREGLFRQAQLAAEHDDMALFDQLCSDLANLIRGDDYNDMSSRIAWLRARYLVGKGSIKQHLQEVNQQIENRQSVDKKNGNEDQRIQHVTKNLDQLVALRDDLQHVLDAGGDTLATVSGTLTRSDGTPIAYAGVFLRDDKRNNGSIVDNEPYQTMTNGKGEYMFKGVMPGGYQLNMGLNLDQINGWTWPSESDDWIDIANDQDLNMNVVFQPLLELKSPVNQTVIKGGTINFRWEPVKGAAYYDLSVGLQLHSGSMGSNIRQRIHSPDIDIPADELYHHLTGMTAYSDQNRKMITDPLSLIGFSNPDNRFSWSINAYDKEGNLLTRSEGYRLGSDKIGNLPFFYLKERTMTQADQTLLKGQLDEAMAGYKKDYAKDPSDAHSLHMMIVLLEAKSFLENQKEATMKQSPALVKAWEEEQIRYLKQIVKLKPTGEYISRLSSYYYKKEDWDQYNRYYDLFMQSNKLSDISYIQSIHAIAMMKQGRIKEARSSFTQALDQDKSHRFIGSYIALELLTSGSYDIALQLADKYPDRSLTQLHDWAALVSRMKKEAADSATYSKELHQKIGWFVESKEEQLHQWASSEGGTLPGMKDFILALLEVD